MSTQTDLALAHAALAAQLVELEALYQRDADDPRVLELLSRGYTLMAHGFVELRRLDAVAAGDRARADQEASLRDDAEARARYYARRRGSGPVPLDFEAGFAAVQAACDRRDRASYEGELNRLLQRRESGPEGRLNAALVRALAARWLQPRVESRCAFSDP